jgi:hypothetical protein
MLLFRSGRFRSKESVCLVIVDLVVDFDIGGADVLPRQKATKGNKGA